MAKQGKQSITHPHLLLCEGEDADFFLRHWLAACIPSDPSMDEIQIWDFGGITELTKALVETLPLIAGWEMVRSVTVVRDAEKNAVAAVQSIKDSFQKASLSVPDRPFFPSTTDNHGIRTGFVLFPSCTCEEENGTLEDLCLNILAGENATATLEAADAFLADVQEKNEKNFHRLHKNRLHAYLSATDKYVSMKIGEAAKANAFRWDCPQLKNLAVFLRKMIQR